VNGRVVPGVLPELLREIYVGRLTGMLRFARGEAHCSIRFVKGHLVYGFASEKKLHMGEVMVAEGLLSRENLDRATQVVTTEKKRLGEALESLGLVDSELLEEFLAIHLREILLHLFSWRDGMYAFEEQDPESKLEFDFPIKMTTGEAIIDAVRRVKDRQSILFALGDLEGVLLQSTEPLLRFQRVSLTTVDGFVLSRVDGTLSAAEIIRITPLEDEAVESSLFALLATGILEHAPEEAKVERPSSAQFLRQEILDFHRKLSDSNHFEVLGLRPTAREKDVKAAFLRLAKRYHPDVHHDPALSDLQDKLETIFISVTEAHRVLSDPNSREAHRVQVEGPSPAVRGAPSAPARPAPVPTPDPASQAAHAEGLFHAGEERFQEAKYWEAMALLGEAVRVAEGRLLLRARLLLAKAFLKHPEKEREAEKELLAVLEADPEHGEAHFHLGTIYKRRGWTARASSMFRKVLELDPSHREAIAGLASLEAKPEPAQSTDAKGMLKKLFGKG
jgi:tetratricopeptide (TPR) repeat protein